MNYKIMGITDERTTCEKCSKQNLKRVVVLQPIDSNDVVYFGTDCAAQALRGKKSASNNKIVATQAGAIEFARKMLIAHGSDKAAVAVWNRFGYCAEAKAGAVLVQIDKGVIAIVFRDGSVNYRIAQ